MHGTIFVSDYVAERWGERLDSIAEATPRVVLGKSGLQGDATTIEVAFFSQDIYPDRSKDFFYALLEVDGLRWLHSFSAGVDHPIFQAFLDKGVRLTTSSGAAAQPIAHTVLLYILHHSRNMDAWLDAQRQHQWAPHDVTELAGRTLAVIGLGPIGLEVARLGRAFDMHVIGLRRQPRGDEPCETWPLERLAELLTTADYVLLALPLTAETRGLLDRPMLARMKRGAFLVNVARGGMVDEAALAEMLESGHLSGAALDVFDEEPLPADSLLWDTPGLIVTPHSSGECPGIGERAAEMFFENLGRYRRGDPLISEVGNSD